MNRIGLDGHSASFTMAVMNEAGQMTKCLSRPTSAENMIELVSAVPGPKELIVEESTITQWIKETLEPYVDRLIICDPRRNRWIALIDEIEEMKQECLEAMVCRARKEKGYEWLLTMPGVGPVLGSGYVALIGTPHRFSRKNKLWRYAALGNSRHISDDKVYRDCPSRTGNRPLKWVVVQHFMGAVERSRNDNAFKRRYKRLLAQGLGRKAAKRHVCRSLLSVARAIWMKGEPYRETTLNE